MKKKHNAKMVILVIEGTSHLHKILLWSLGTWGRRGQKLFEFKQNISIYWPILQTFLILVLKTLKFELIFHLIVSQNFKMEPNIIGILYCVHKTNLKCSNLVAKLIFWANPGPWDSNLGFWVNSLGGKDRLFEVIFI